MVTVESIERAIGLLEGIRPGKWRDKTRVKDDSSSIYAPVHYMRKSTARRICPNLFNVQPFTVIVLKLSSS